MSEEKQNARQAVLSHLRYGAKTIGRAIERCEEQIEDRGRALPGELYALSEMHSAVGALYHAVACLEG